MTTEYAAAIVCLKDAKQHALASANYEMAAEIAGLLHKFDPKPKACPTCGMTVRAPGGWHLAEKAAQPEAPPNQAEPPPEGGNA